MVVSNIFDLVPNSFDFVKYSGEWYIRACAAKSKLQQDLVEFGQKILRQDERHLGGN